MRSQTSPRSIDARTRRRAGPCPPAAPSPPCPPARFRTRSRSRSSNLCRARRLVATSPIGACARLPLAIPLRPVPALRRCSAAARGARPRVRRRHLDRVHRPLEIGSPSRIAVAVRRAAPSDECGLGLVEVEPFPAERRAGRSPRTRPRARPRSARTHPRRPPPRPRPRTTCPSPPRTARDRAGSTRTPCRRRARSDRLPLALRAAPAGLADRSAVRLGLAGADRRQQRAVGDEVRIAPDRRGEVSVRRAAEAGVAEVSLGVVRLLQRAQHEGCIRIPAMPSPAASRATRRLASPASAPRLAETGARAAAAWARPSAVSCATRRSIRCRVGLLMHPVERRHLASLAELGHPLVGQDHQVLDQAVGLGLVDGVGADHRSVASRTRTPARTTRSRASRRACSPAPPPRDVRRASGSATAAGGESGRRRTGRAGRSRAARPSGCGCPIEAGRARLAARRQRDLGRHREAVDPRREAARLVAEQAREHRLHRARHVGARPARSASASSPPPGRTWADTSAMWIQSRTPSPSASAETASSKSRAVAGSTVKVATCRQVAASRGASVRRRGARRPPSSSAAGNPRRPHDPRAGRRPRRAGASAQPRARSALAPPRRSRPAPGHPAAPSTEPRASGRLAGRARRAARRRRSGPRRSTVATRRPTPAPAGDSPVLDRRLLGQDGKCLLEAPRPDVFGLSAADVRLDPLAGERGSVGGEVLARPSGRARRRLRDG